MFGISFLVMRIISERLQRSITKTKSDNKLSERIAPVEGIMLRYKSFLPVIPVKSIQRRIFQSNYTAMLLLHSFQLRIHIVIITL